MFDILLLDDERWVRTALKKTIEKTELPFRVVHESTNGVEAMDWLTENKVSIVITDIRMPVMDGLAFMKQIRSRNMDPTVIIISGHDDFAYAQQALRLGAFDYMLKPAETETVAMCLQNWLDRRNKAFDDGSVTNLFDMNEISPIEKVTRYIDSMPVPRLKLTEAAAMLHLDPSYFSKLFKQRTRVNFSDYLTMKRMETAVTLLEETSLRISEIAERLGYADLAYFSNIFKKSMGRAPSEYRKAHANELT
jgi:YesN/AraC family two-component response regulator